MAKQEKCEKAMKDVAQAFNKMFAFKPLKGDEAIKAGREVMEKIRAERAEKREKQN